MRMVVFVTALTCVVSACSNSDEGSKTLMAGAASRSVLPTVDGARDYLSEVPGWPRAKRWTPMTRASSSRHGTRARWTSETAARIQLGCMTICEQARWRSRLASSASSSSWRTPIPTSAAISPSCSSGCEPRLPEEWTEAPDLGFGDTQPSRAGHGLQHQRRMVLPHGGSARCGGRRRGGGHAAGHHVVGRRRSRIRGG